MKNRIYAQPSAKEGWRLYLEATPRDETVSLPPIHNIPDGNFKEDNLDPNNK